MYYKPHLSNAYVKNSHGWTCSKLNPKINRNFEIFTGPDFLATITRHIPDKGTQMIRYSGWYSHKTRGQRHRVQNGGVP
jgi:hypothetical protein